MQKALADNADIFISIHADDSDNPKQGKKINWDTPTQKQVESGVRLVKCLLKKYNLSITDIYWHDQIQAKAGGEGEDFYKLIVKQLK